MQSLYAQQKNNMKKIFFIIIGIIAIFLLVRFIIVRNSPPTVTVVPKSEITYANATPELIDVDAPIPGATLTSHTFSITGKAKGTWYFEGSFPVEVRDLKGALIANSIAKAEGEWMTTNAVPFTASVTIPQAYTGGVMVILKNDNPSGMPENDRSISFPVFLNN